MTFWGLGGASSDEASPGRSASRARQHRTLRATRCAVAASAILLALPSYADDAPRLWAIDGGVCLSDAALVASERDRQATKLELSEARQQKASVLVGVSVGALVLGAVVGFVARPYLRP